jgi:hypothetical protein
MEQCPNETDCLDKFIRYSVKMCFYLAGIYILIACLIQTAIYAVNRPADIVTFIPNSFVLVPREHTLDRRLEIYPSDEKGEIIDASTGYVYNINGPLFQAFGIVSADEEISCYARSGFGTTWGTFQGSSCPKYFALEESKWILNEIKTRLGWAIHPEFILRLDEDYIVDYQDNSTIQIKTSGGIVVAQAIKTEEHQRWLVRLLGDQQNAQTFVLTIGIKLFTSNSICCPF